MQTFGVGGGTAWPILLVHRRENATPYLFWVLRQKHGTRFRLEMIRTICSLFLGFGHVAYRCISAALDFVSSICLYKCCGQEKENHGGAAIEAQTWVTQFHSNAVTSFVRPFPFRFFFQCRRPHRHPSEREEIYPFLLFPGSLAG